MKAFWISLVWLFAAFLFYLAFFVLAPAITKVIPESQWKGLLDFAVYFFVAWCGGIGIPLTIGIIGTTIIVAA